MSDPAPDPTPVFNYPGRVVYDPGSAPHMELARAAVTITVHWDATDGSKPGEIMVDWATDPGPDAVCQVIDAMVASVLPPIYDTAEPDARARLTDPEITRDLSIIRPAPADADTERIQVYCGAQGEGHEGDGHGCGLRPGHDPVEIDGRRHRCRCGGIMSAYEEVPDVPGRREQERMRGAR